MDYKKPKRGFRLPKKTTEIKEKREKVERPKAVSNILQDNIDAANHTFEESLDFIMRKVTFGPSGKVKMAVAFLETLSDKDTLSDFVLEPLLTMSMDEEELMKNPSRIMDSLPSAIQIEEADDWDKIEDGIVTGHAVLFIDGYDKALIMEVRFWNERGIAEPQSESVVIGPREGFVESLITNVSLVRRRVRTPDLVMEAIPVGSTTNTNVVVTYVKGVADEKLVEKIRKRIEKMDMEAMYSVNLINEIAADSRYTPFQMFATTERPDKVASAVMEGRIAIIAENTPMALLIPTVFWQFFQTSEDYYEHFPLATFNRVLRMFSFFVVVGFTAFYVAIVTYHQEMVPTQLILAMASARQPVPFPTAVEALFLEVILEGLREAGLRLPKPAGQAVSIVGALVMGQAAVEAGLVSPQLVIVVALSGIASFLIPDYSFVIALRILKFGFIFLASVFGIFGLMIGYMILGTHLASLQSFGVPYLSPVTPFKWHDMKDIFVRVPWWAMGKRDPQEQEKEDSEDDQEN